MAQRLLTPARQKHDDDDEVTAEAYASISAQLASWTSPKLGTMTSVAQEESEMIESTLRAIMSTESPLFPSKFIDTACPSRG